MMREGCRSGWQWDECGGGRTHDDGDELRPRRTSVKERRAMKRQMTLALASASALALTGRCRDPRMGNVFSIK